MFLLIFSLLGLILIMKTDNDLTSHMDAIHGIIERLRRGVTWAILILSRKICLCGE
jgi:hypothetical protein